jgi:hypothetical protein
MFAGMLVRRRVAATDMSAGKTQTQMDPTIAGLDAVFTHMFIGMRNPDLIKMSAFLCHEILQ